MTTGNNIVDQIGEMNISGTVVPNSWLLKIRNKTGNMPDLVTIYILSEILYWYRPSIHQDEAGQIMGVKKKFNADYWQCSYRYFEKKLGITTKTVRSSLAKLEELHLIKKHLETIKTSSGLTLNNVMFLELIPDEIKAITEETPPSPQGRRVVPHGEGASCPAGKEPGSPPGRTYTKTSTQVSTHTSDIIPETLDDEEYALLNSSFESLKTIDFDPKIKNCFTKLFDKPVKIKGHKKTPKQVIGKFKDYSKRFESVDIALSELLKASQTDYEEALGRNQKITDQDRYIAACIVNEMDKPAISPVPKKPKNAFNNFEQRSDDLDALVDRKTQEMLKKYAT